MHAMPPIYADPSTAQHVQCFSAKMCAGDSIGLNSSNTAADQINECCINTQGLSYNDTVQCVDCLGKRKLLLLFQHA